MASTHAMVRLACELGTTDRIAPMRDPSPIEDARRALASLSRDERITLARELFATIAGEDTP